MWGSSDIVRPFCCLSTFLLTSRFKIRYTLIFLELLMLVLIVCYRCSSLCTVTGLSGIWDASTSLVSSLHSPGVCKIITVLCQKSWKHTNMNNDTHKRWQILLNLILPQMSLLALILLSFPVLNGYSSCCWVLVIQIIS